VIIWGLAQVSEDSDNLKTRSDVGRMLKRVYTDEVNANRSQRLKATQQQLNTCNTKFYSPNGRRQNNKI